MMTSTRLLSQQQQQQTTPSSYLYLHQQHACSNNAAAAAEDADNNNTTLSSSRHMLLGMIKEHHASFLMEHRDRPNVLIRVLVGLHEFGAKDDQLAQVYSQLYPELTPLRRAHVHIDRDNWLEFLGNSGYYGDYLAFFDQQLDELGMKGLLEQYFYTSPLQHSLGSQLQPLVHLAFGIEQNLPHVVTQGLAYTASTYLDASELCELTRQEQEQRQQQPVTLTTTNDELLFDLVGADQRFGGKIDGRNTFHSSVKVLLKSKADLLKTYMAVWQNISSTATTTTATNTTSSIPQHQQALNQLIAMATRLITYSNHVNQGQIELDWFLGGGQLLASALAIQTMIDHCPPTLSVDSLVNLQFLATLCTYIVQGRPPRAHYAPYNNNNYTSATAPLPSPPLDWSDCVAAVVQSADPKAILTMHSLKRAAHSIGNDDHLYLDTANFLVNFVHDGIWVKGGIGW
ncbi:hypothetical protein BDB00DRAFT_495571 [Zychaea mexicana]|uniref:uncharacterized protein n=1 Tax=Zychaea mexicana TaxID=64656 RepID=UPI0022FEEC13|nr:uncharacterized protein BDB00DRAFT_495571 [Zychaea mexicana]KAI9498031.1 hypothetical protein BDB00DRAFT_495571 [Zychaea mexicana]